MTANVITYRHKSASREMGKVLGISQEMVDRLSTVFSNFEWKDPSDTLEKSFWDAGLDISHPLIGKYVHLVWNVMDLPRHSWPAQRRHGGLPGAIGFGSSAGTSLNARPGRLPMGQR
jgi:hypothetical protein